MAFVERGKILVILPPAVGDGMIAIPLLEALSHAGYFVHTVRDRGMAGLVRTYDTYIEHEYLLSVKRWRATSPLRDIKGRLSC